jgi:raffinose/stachyose/melibiose transport system permease protein
MAVNPVDRSSAAGRIGRVVFNVIWALMVALPLYYMVLTSFRSQGGYLTSYPWLPTGQLTLDQYKAVIDQGFFRYFLNSAIVTVAAVAITLTVSVLAAHRVVLNRSRLSRATFRYMLIGLAVPVQALMIPVFVVIDNAHLYDTLLALILTGVAFSIPVSVLILVNFLRDVPAELTEAMQIDGATDRQVLLQLVLPLSKPALIMLAVYDGLVNWNNFVLPLVLTTSPGARVLPLELFNFETEFGVNVPGVLASVVLATLPMVLVFVFGYRYIVRGLAVGLGGGGAFR